MSLIYINNKESHSLACRNKLGRAAPQFRLKYKLFISKNYFIIVHYIIEVLLGRTLNTRKRHNPPMTIGAREVLKNSGRPQESSESH